MLELITIINDGEIHNGRYWKIVKAEKFEREGDTRTITRYETQGKKIAWKKVTQVGLGKDDFYQDGRLQDVPYKEASKFIRECFLLTEKAKEKYGNNHICTYYFNPNPPE